MAVAAIASERGRRLADLALPLFLLRREESNEEERRAELKGIRRREGDEERVTPWEAGRHSSWQGTVEAYVIINVSKVNVFGIGDVPIYGYITYTKGSAEVSAEKKIVVLDGPPNSVGWMTTYHINEKGK